MADLSALSSFPTTAKALGDIVLVKPSLNMLYSPQDPDRKDGKTGIPPEGYKFHYEGENLVNLKSNITDHYVEDNTAIHDHVALSPETITVNGFIGDLNNVPPEELAAIKIFADKLTIIDGYTPSLSITAIKAYNKAFQQYLLEKSLQNASISAWNSLADNDKRTQNIQQQAFNYFQGHWIKRTLFEVQTPWAIITDCIIESIKVAQDADTRVISSFQMTFKRLRFAKTDLATQEEVVNRYQTRLANQASKEINLGVISPTPGPSVSTALTGVK